MDARADRVGPSGPAGHLGPDHRHPARARGGRRRPRVPLGRGGGGARAPAVRGVRRAAAGRQPGQLRIAVARRLAERADPHVAHHRSRRRADAGPHAGGGAARRRQPGAPARPSRRFLGGPQPVGALHHPRHAARPEQLQQQHPDPADAGRGRAAQRDDQRDARRAARRPPAPPGRRPALERRLARPVGWGHAGRRDAELQLAAAVPRPPGRRPAPGRAVHPHRPGPHRLRDDARRPGDLHAPLDRRPPDDPDRRADLRVRLPRGELRHGGNPRRAPGGGGRGQP